MTEPAKTTAVDDARKPQRSQWSEEHLRNMAAAEDEAGCINIGSADEVMEQLAGEAPCTCHPSERPFLCQHEYAWHGCRISELEAQLADAHAQLKYWADEATTIIKEQQEELDESWAERTENLKHFQTQVSQLQATVIRLCKDKETPNG